jgi:hypothetical protein
VLGTTSTVRSRATHGDTVCRRRDRKLRYLRLHDTPRKRRGPSRDCCFAWLHASRTARIRRPERTNGSSARPSPAGCCSSAIASLSASRAVPRVHVQHGPVFADGRCLEHGHLPWSAARFTANPSLLSRRRAAHACLARPSSPGRRSQMSGWPYPGAGLPDGRTVASAVESPGGRGDHLGHEPDRQPHRVSEDFAVTATVTPRRPATARAYSLPTVREIPPAVRPGTFHSTW